MSETYSSREELIDGAIKVWKKHGDDYRTILSEYNAFINIIDNKDKYLEKFNELGIEVPELEEFKRLDELFLDEYPKIPYLGINDKRQTRKYLEMLDSYIILEQLKEAERFNDYPIVMALRERLIHLEQIFWRGNGNGRYSKVNAKSYKNNAAAIDPRYCSSGKHSRGRKVSCMGGVNVNEQ